MNVSLVFLNAFLCLYSHVIFPIQYVNGIIILMNLMLS